MRYNGAIDNLLQGVSQQPEKERRPEQLASQTNCWSSIVKGLGKRPGTYHLKKLQSSFFPAGEDTKLYSYDRGDLNERYMFGFGDSEITALDLFTGNPVTVNYEASTDYLATDNPQEDLVFHTIADTTFIVNKTITPETGTPTDSRDTWEMLIYCKQANWGKTYSITVDGSVIATYTTPATVTLSTTASTTEQSKNITLDTTDIISNLASGVQSWATANGVSWDFYEDLMYLYKDGADYTLTTTDGSNGNDLFSIKDQIANYDNLPAIARDGFKVEVTGVDTSTENNYYVVFNADAGASNGRGVWEECAGFGVDTEFVATTMPHKLVRESDGEFYFRTIDWTPRTAGDDDTNPKPSFVGSTISNILTYQGRLVLTTEENQCGSVTFDYFNFWADSVLKSSDDDPIDTASSDNQVTNLHHSLVFNSSLVSFSDRAQFIHPGDIAFTSKTFSLASKSHYNSNIQCEPKAAANSVFFAFDSGIFTGIHEMRFEAVTGNIAVDKITEQCKKYIEGSAVQIETSTDYNILLVRTDTSDDLFVFEWYDREGKRLQAAWHKWSFGAPVRFMKIIAGTLYIVTKRSSDYSLEYIDLTDQDTAGIDFPVRLDMMEILTPSEINGVYKITPTLTAYTDISLDNLVLLGGNDSGIAGTELNWVEDSGSMCVSSEYLTLTESYITDDGIILTDDDGVPLEDDSTLTFIVGLRNNSEAEITNPYVRDNFDKPKTIGDLRLATMDFNLAGTGYIEFEISTTSNVYTKVYDTKIIDGTLFALNAPPSIVDASVKVPIRSSRGRCSIKIKSDSHLPFYVSDIDWTGEYYEAGRRTR